MKQTELYNKLHKAYSTDNLNIITGKLIDLYKNKNFIQIREIANKISKYVIIDEEKDSKCFSKLIVLYHPDKGRLIRETLKTSYTQNDLVTLTSFSHILLLDDIDKLKISTTVSSDIEYEPEYSWDENQEEGYQFFNDDDDENEEYNNHEDFEKTFYNAVKLRMYGNLEMEFPHYYLEDFEDFELANCEIEYLDGIEHCIHVTSLDLSNNNITDITELRELTKLRELFISDNKIGYIDALGNLLELVTVDLSNNQIDDITPLFNLINLEFVNLIGNRIPMEQIKVLKEKGIIVMN